MNNEIKEKLDNLRIYVGREENGFICDIEDYITNLQEELKSANESISWWTNRFNAVEKENKRLKEELEITQEKWDKDIQFVECRTKEWLDYKTRNEKAIEYIKEHIRIDDEYPAYMEMLVEEKDELLKILQGGDK